MTVSQLPVPQPTEPPKGVFDKYLPDVMKHRYHIGLEVYELHGGVPASAKVAVAWLRKRIEGSDDSTILELAREVVMQRHNIDPATDDADEQLAALEAELTTTDLEEMVAKTKVNGFQRNEAGQLCLRRRNAQAMLKEAANVTWPAKKWGPTRKGTLSYWPEHFFVDEVWLPITHNGFVTLEPHEVSQSFVQTWRGSSIKYEEVLYDGRVDFTLSTDIDLKKKEWAELWLRAERLGIGASRSQAVGQFKVVEFDKL